MFIDGSPVYQNVTAGFRRIQSEVKVPVSKLPHPRFHTQPDPWVGFVITDGQLYFNAMTGQLIGTAITTFTRAYIESLKSVIDLFEPMCRSVPD